MTKIRSETFITSSNSNPFRVIFLLETDREYVVQIVAVDSFGQKSEPIVSEGIYVQI